MLRHIANPSNRGSLPPGRTPPTVVFTPLPARGLLVAVVMAALVGCTDTGPTVPPPPTPTTATPTEPLPATTVTTAPAQTTASEDGCPEGDVMVADGRLLGFNRPTTDATRIAGITWRTSGGCLLVTITFATDDGAPATTPPTMTARVLRSAGVVRVDTEATSSVVADQLLEEDLVERLFVPVDDEGLHFIDLVLDAPVVARARVLTSPARLEIELQSGGPPEIGSPLISSELVVIEPGSAAVAEPILDVTGYSIGDLDEITLTVLRGEATVSDVVVVLESEAHRWRAFNVTIPIGEAPYDNLRITTADESVVAGIPFSG